MIITLGDALKELMRQIEQNRKRKTKGRGKPMTQLQFFNQKPILEVLKPIRFQEKYSRQPRRNLRKMKKVKNFL